MIMTSFPVYLQDILDSIMYLWRCGSVIQKMDKIQHTKYAMEKVKTQAVHEEHAFLTFVLVFLIIWTTCMCTWANGSSWSIGFCFLK